MAVKLKAAVSQVWLDVEDSVRHVYGSYRYCLHHCYASLADRADVTPYAILPLQTSSPEEILKDFDILILSGGGDPDPSLFGQVNKGSREPEMERPLWDMELYRAACRMEKPVLGICLGMQLIGISHGVSLIQDIESECSNPLNHDGSSKHRVFHQVTITRDSILEEALGTCAEVSSYHHQALAECPSGFKVTARSSDGVIEAIERLDGRVIGVQWHPERDSTGTAIMDRIVRIARLV